MTTTHLSDTEIEQFIIGALDPDRLPEVEAHAAACDTCAARLAREARFEVRLAAVARAPRRRRTIPVFAAGAVLAAAAALLLIVRGTVHPPAGGRVAALAVICPDGADQAACVRTSHRHGLFVQYPDSAGPPSGGGSLALSGPSESPFP